MALCLAESLLECGAFDPDDQMRRYLRWRDEGHLSSNGRCFDIGGTVGDALRSYERTGQPFSGPTEPNRAGNGSIMRLAPVVLFFHPDRDAVDEYAAESSRTTHGAAEAVAACRILAGVLSALLDGGDKESGLAALEPAPWMSPSLQGIARGDYRTKAESDVRGTGYAVASLEAALWCFSKTDSFEQAILAAANLGDDADTTAAVCGQLAGAHYGEEGIPDRWLDWLVMRERIGEWAEALMEWRGRYGKGGSRR